MAWRIGGRDVDGVRRLGWLTLFGAPAGLAGGLWALTGRGVPCPFLLATGWLCPFCGGSRMGAALLSGDLGAAWAWNPFLMILGGGLVLVWLWTVARLLQHRSVALPGALNRLERLSLATLVMALVVPALVFMVLRNVF